MENEIAEQLLLARVDVLLSGGWRHFLPAAANTDGEIRDAWTVRLGNEELVESRREDERDLVAEAEIAGYSTVFDVAGLLNAVEAGGPVLGLFSASSMQNAFQSREWRDEPTRIQPGLDEMAQAALNILGHAIHVLHESQPGLIFDEFLARGLLVQTAAGSEELWGDKAVLLLAGPTRTILRLLHSQYSLSAKNAGKDHEEK
jgi:hypothetical protein